MQIKKAEYYISCPKLVNCPESTYPEFAFIGRSNVGKSSLINFLCRHKSLAKTSNTPGKTRLINYFLINDNIYFVDLPGYGYAKISQKQRNIWIQDISEYLKKRKQLTLLLVLIDSAVNVQNIDILFINQLGKWGIPFAIVFTKTDKEKQQIIHKNTRLFLSSLQDTWEELPPYFYVSSKKKIGNEALLTFIKENLTANFS